MEAAEAERRRIQREKHEAELALELARREHLMEQLRRVLRHNREIEADFQVTLLFKSFRI